MYISCDWFCVHIFFILPVLCSNIFQLTGFVFTCMAIHIYGEESESCKYIEHTSTYIRPKDHPSARYAPVESVQRERDSRCLPTYVSYAESMEWCQSGSGPRARNCDNSGQVSSVSLDMIGQGNMEGDGQALV